MDTYQILGVSILAVLALVVLVFYVFNVKHNQRKINIEGEVKHTVVDGELSLLMITEWFKQNNLNSQKDVPFVAVSGSDILPALSLESHKGKKQVLVAGVYNDLLESIGFINVFYTSQFDADVAAIIGNEKMVVLN